MELPGGLAIFVGAFVEIVSVPLIVMILVAMFTVHLKYGFSSVNTIGLTEDGPQFGPSGYEVNLLYIAGLFSLILSGAGALSFDGLLSRNEALSEGPKEHQQAVRTRSQSLGGRDRPRPRSRFGWKSRNRYINQRSHPTRLRSQAKGKVGSCSWMAP